MASKINEQVKLWGVITDHSCKGMTGVVVKLLKKERRKKRSIYRIIQQTLTDSQGRYQFFVNKQECGQYKIVILDER